MYNIHTKGLRFAWDKAKERSNIRKHGVSFTEAAMAFDDSHARRYFDLEHSDDEDRFILLGLSSSFSLIVVCHCYRESGRIIRIISARKANGQEAEDYQRQRHDA